MLKKITVCILSVIVLTACGTESDSNKLVQIDKSKMWNLTLNKNIDDKPSYEEWLSNKDASDTRFSRSIYNYYEYIDTDIDLKASSDPDKMAALLKQLTGDIKSGKSQSFYMAESILENNWEKLDGSFNRMHKRTYILIQTAETHKLCENGAEESQYIQVQHKGKLGDIETTSGGELQGTLKCGHSKMISIRLEADEENKKDFILSKLNKGESVKFSGNAWSIEIPGFTVKSDKKV